MQQLPAHRIRMLYCSASQMAVQILPCRKEVASLDLSET